MGSKKIATIFLFLSFLISAAPAQQLRLPTEQNWAELRSEAASARSSLAARIQSLQQELERRKKMAKDLPSREGLPHESWSIKPPEDRLNRLLEADAKTSALLSSLQAIPGESSDRAQYLKLRVQLKGIRAALDSIERYSFGPDNVDNEKNLIKQIEAARHAAAKNPAPVIPASPPPRGIRLSWATYPRVDGSTTAQPLSALIACRMLGLGAVWQTRSGSFGGGDEVAEKTLAPLVGQGHADLSSLPILGGMLSATGLTASMAHTGTHTAYRNLILELSDLILVAREPSSDELALAKEKGVELDVRPAGHDAFVFLLNDKNPLTSLTISQIQGIYQDQYYNWAELGGNDAPIIAFQRERNSGSQETMESLVMKNQTMSPADQMLIGLGMMGPYNQLHGQPNGIGYTFYYYHNFQASKAGIQMCAVNGIKPSPATIASKAYPFVTDLYAVVRKNQDAQSPAIQLRDWLLTPEGQVIVKESGYVPLGTPIS